MNRYLQFAKHNFFYQNCFFVHTNSENVNIAIFNSLIWIRASFTEKVRPKSVKKVPGHLKIVVQTTNTSKISDETSF